MNVLQLSAHFSPNVGGVETHLDDLVAGLVKRKHQVTVLTYQPLTTDIRAPFYVKKGRLEVIRIAWINGLFEKLVTSPVLEFLYLIPGLFFGTLVVMLRRDYQVIHAHGLVAATAGVFWGKIFNKKIVVSTHSLYDFPKTGFYRRFVKFVLSKSDNCLCLSEKAVQELKDLGIDQKKLIKFTYWINIGLFKPLNDRILKSKFNLTNRFVILFVGRLIEKKGIKVLIQALKQTRGRVTLIIAGDGPLRDEILRETQSGNNIRFVGRLSPEELVNYYNLSDLLVVPSIHDEGFGRVILEALACGTPALGSDRGSIPEALDKSVGRLVKVTVKNLQTEIAYLRKRRDVLKKLGQNARAFAVKRYSEKNIENIIKSYDN